jgi:hypothetical protein
LLSGCDDPPLMGGLVPWDVAVDPHRMRWGMCTQEQCFKRHWTLIHALAGCGQALPIWQQILKSSLQCDITGSILGQ